MAATVTSLVRARLRPPETCTWCSTTSGHRVTGHETRLCKGHVQELRRRRLDRMAKGAPWEPDPFGNLWLLPEEIEGQGRTDPHTLRTPLPDQHRHTWKREASWTAYRRTRAVRRRR
ncbi:hypothetical protein BN159_1229 [Streptomyces davaonensis JCM 4913]|uniref:Uncharacterized protein n=1 Tax=Streptomyces davaonensis (strain DSM 101723 / JCM 4913 / KCC S-0913 / 768) TaxID=1214101 RepID=K4QX33_STRDJ|nr:hypothetical protein BN159_1229 [Streptomyces davaonensis JCM 4913]